VLYTIDKSILNQQISDQVKKLKEADTPEMAAAFDSITQQLLERGMEWAD
jgi:hypothetical protein